MQGTVKNGAILKDGSGKTIMDLRVGDRVEGNGIGAINKVWRNGLLKFPAGNTSIGYVSWAYAIKSDEVIPPPPPTEPAKFARLLHCSQTSVTQYKTYMNWRFGNNKPGAGDPSCFKYPFAKENYLRPTREMEDWWFGLLEQAAQNTMTAAQLEIAWKNLVNPKKAFTNNRDLEVWGYRINGKQMRMEPIICTGATVKLRGDPFLRDGIYWQSFEVIDMLKKDWRNMTLDSHWWLIQAATNSLNVPGGEIIDPFPKMAGNRMTPYFLWGLATDTGYLPAAWFESIAGLTKRAYPYLKSGSVADIERFADRTPLEMHDDKIVL